MTPNGLSGSEEIRQDQTADSLYINS